MRQMLSDRLRLTILVSLVLSAFGILLQIIGGWDYPAIPPGLVITLAGGLAALIPFRWGPVLTLLVGAFIIVGFVAVGDYANLGGTQNLAITSGKWLQMVMIVVGIGAAVASLVRPPDRAALARPARR